MGNMILPAAPSWRAAYECPLVQRFEVGNDLPAALLGDPGPGRHAVYQIAVAEKPRELAGRGVLHAGRAQVRGATAAESVLAVAFRAVLAEKLFTGSNRVGLALVGIFLVARLCRSLGNHLEYATAIQIPIVTSRGNSGERRKKERGENQQGSHWNWLLTLRPKPPIS